MKEKSTKRILGGKKAQRNGQSFESYFKLACAKEGVSFTRIPNGAKRIAKDQFIPEKSPFDCILSVQGVLSNKIALIDTKSTLDSFNHSDCKLHQLEELSKHEGPSIIAGYVIWFKAIDRMLFVSAKHLLQRMGSRGSIRYSDVDTVRVIDLGSSLDLKLRDRLFRA